MLRDSDAATDLPAFEPAEADYQATVQSMFAGQPFMHHIGAALTRLAPGFAEIQLPYRRAVTQHNGYFHGGVVATLADNSGGSAGYTLIPARQGLLTVEFKLNLLAPGRGERLIARGRVIRAGPTLIVSSADVYAHEDGTETLCASQLMTLMVVERRA